MAKRQKLSGGRIAEVKRVANAYGNGFDRQVVVQHTIDLLRRRGHLNEPQFSAAQKFLSAFELSSAISSALDPSKEGGGAPGPRGKSEQLLMAAETLKHSRDHLGLLDFFIVKTVCGEGRTIDETARAMYGKPTQRQIDGVGSSLRYALTVLAVKFFGRWGGKDSSHIVKIILADNARPTEISTGEIDRLAKAHTS